MGELNRGGKTLVFLLGGAIGACLGLLFAPQAGKETRKKVRIFFDDLVENNDELKKGRKEIEKFLQSSEKAVKKIIPK